MSDQKEKKKNSDFEIDSELSDFLKESNKMTDALESVVLGEYNENDNTSATINNDVKMDDSNDKKIIDENIQLDEVMIDSQNDNSDLENIELQTEKAENKSDVLDNILLDYNATAINESEAKQMAINKSPNSAALDDIIIEAKKRTNNTQMKFGNNNNSQIKAPTNTKIKSNIKKKVKKVKVNYSIFTGLIITFIVLTVSFVIAFFGISVGVEYLGVNKSDSYIKLNIESGSTVDDIADLLEDKGLIDNKFLFKVIVKLKNAGASMYPGDVELKPSSSYADKIDALMIQREKFETVKVTFPEGISLYSAAKLLENNGVITDAIEFIHDFNSSKTGYDFENIIGVKSKKFYTMEGYFFPETYEFYKNDSNENIIAKIRKAFNDKFTDEMKQQLNDSGMTMDEVITLASIVQAEAGNDKDMTKVSSVFINRLNNTDKFPRLESDATENYYNNVIKVAANESKEYTETEIKAFKDVYDTYDIAGLPAGPICNPGSSAIKAVLNPAKTGYYYFCSNLSTKKTYFAKTLAAHNKNLITAGLV